MTASPDNTPFRFETSYTTRDGRPDVLTSQVAASRRPMRAIADRFFVICGVGGIACLFWRYTVALGVVTLGLATFVWAMRQRSEARWKRRGRVQEPLQTVHVTLTESGFSLKGDDFLAEAKWTNVVRGVELNGFLLVQSWRVPRFYIPVDELRRAGLYDRIRAIVHVPDTMPVPL